MAALIAVFASFVSYVVYRTQADPDFIVYVQPDEERQSVVNLVIDNIGEAAARDITFESCAAIPGSAFTIDRGKARDAVRMTSGPLVRGIPFLPPGGKRTVTWGQYGGLVKAIGENVIWVAPKYSCRHVGVPWKSNFQSACRLEVVCFSGTDCSDKNFVGQIANNVERLAKAVEKVGKANGRSV